MAVVSAAMPRPPGGIESPYFANQRINYEETDESKSSKRLWPPRYKVNANATMAPVAKGENAYLYGTISAPGGSALSKSMKYAETWLYGTVRSNVSPIRPSIFSSYPEVTGPVLISTPQKKPTQNYAVIICSCPEYLNGTKKSSSTKVSICKKCKGSRLPITLTDGPRIMLGGTVRGPQTNRDISSIKGGTMKPLGVKNRPSILNLKSQSKDGADPYDMMRRTRMATPHETRIGSQFTAMRTRAKSTSPSRTRVHKQSPAQEPTRKFRSKSVTRQNDIWVEDAAEYVQDSNRRSILMCNLNPYELMKTKNTTCMQSINYVELDDDLNDICNENFLHKSKSNQTKKQKSPYFHTHAISGQRIRISNNKVCTVEEVSVYDQVDISDEAKCRFKTQEISPNVPTPDSKAERNRKKFSTPQNTNVKKNLVIPTVRAKTKTSPKRPPRRLKLTSEEDSESDHQKEIKRKQEPCSKDSSKQHVRVSVIQNDKIKSILKKPNKNASILSDCEKSSENDSPSPSQIRKVSGSQFYLPMPTNAKIISTQNTVMQRKKVQFLVEKDETTLLCSAELTLSTDNMNSYSTNNTENIVTVVSYENNERKSVFFGDDPADVEMLSTDINDKLLSSYEDVFVCAPSNESILSESSEVRISTDTVEITNDKDNSTEVSNSSNSEKALKNIYQKANEKSENEKLEGISVSPHVIVLRRSESERLPVTSMVTPPKFHDSMALRPKFAKLHTSQVFFSANNVTPDEKNIAFAEHLRSDKSSTIRILQTENGNDSVYKIINKNEQNNNIEDSKNSSANSSPEPPPRLKQKENRQNSSKQDRKINYVKTRFIRAGSYSSTSDEWSDSTPEVEQKTILKVCQQEWDNKNMVTVGGDTDQYYECYDTEPRRTSILINGDDCYSTMNVSHDTPIYLSSVVVNDDYTPTTYQSGTTVTINVNSPEPTFRRSSSQVYIKSLPAASITLSQSVESEESPKEVIHKNQALTTAKVNLQTVAIQNNNEQTPSQHRDDFMDSNTSEDISSLLKNPVEAVKRNLVPHVCGKALKSKILEMTIPNMNPVKSEAEIKTLSKHSFVAKLLEEPLLGHLAEGLETELVVKLIENSLIRLKQTRESMDLVGNESEEAMNRLIDVSLLKLQEESDSSNKCLEFKCKTNKSENNDSDNETSNSGNIVRPDKNESFCSAPYESMEYESGMGTTSDLEPMSDCYNASASEVSTEDDANSTRSKFYQMLVDATLCEIEISNNIDDDHHYESIRLNCDPIYEEIGDMPPPLPLNPPPSTLPALDEDKKNMSRSIFEGASKYDILSYLVDAKERGIVPEDTYICNFNNIIETPEEAEEPKEKIVTHQRQISDLTDLSSRVSQLSNGSDSSEDNSLVISTEPNEKTLVCKKSSSEIERNDSGVGSETSKSSRSRWQSHNMPPNLLDKNAPIHLCEDCDSAVETQVIDSGVMYAPLVCRKCAKKRAERKEIITEIVETEEKYGRDLQIILEEFYKPMLVAGLLTQDQLSAIFLNVEELLENNQTLAEKLRDALEIALEQGDEDLLTVNIGKLVLECAPMLHAFSAYCVRQGGAALLLAGLEKEKELLRIFLRVSQMENAVLRRMNLNSFLMVPVQRVTKYPLLLSRLYKVTASHVEGRELLKQAQQKIELHLNHMNAEAKDVSSLKLWRRISSGGSGRRTSSEIDMINIKLRKMAVDVLEWNHDEARFAMEGKLLYTQPNDNNWRRGRTIKLTPINALLVTNGKPTASYKPVESPCPSFPHSTGIREATLLLVREKGGRYTLLREPLYLDRCVVATDQDWDDYFEMQEITSKDTFIFKAEDGARTRLWYQQLQYHAQGSGAWRKRRNALANIMINGMLTRN